MRKNPEATREDVFRAGYRTTLVRFYEGSINRAKKDAGVEEEYMYKGRRWRAELEDELREYVLNVLRESNDGASYPRLARGLGRVKKKVLRKVLKRLVESGIVKLSGKKYFLSSEQD